MNMTAVWRMCAVAVATSLLLAACGSPRLRSAPFRAPDGFDAALWSVVDPTTDAGGTLRVATTRDCGVWNPRRASGGTCRNLLRLVTRQLTAFGAGHGRRSAIAVPDLAVSRGVTDQTRTRWRYRVRQGVQWSDGAPLTATQVADGVRSLGRRVPGVDVRSASAVGDDRIEIVLGAPVGDFDSVLALPLAAPVREDGLFFSGPFVVERRDDTVTVLGRNQYWQPSTDPVRRPLVDRIEIRRVASQDEALALLADGQVDLVMDGSLDADLAERILSDPAVAAAADNPGTGTVWMLALPGFGNAVWDEQACRQAVFSAIDRVAIVDILGRGLPSPAFAARAATTLSAPTIASYDWSFVPFEVGDRSGDVASAQRRLQGCAEAGPLLARLAVPDTAQAAEVAETIAAAVGRAGIEVEIERIPLGTWVEVTTSPRRLKAQGIDWVLMQRSAAIPGVWGYWYPLVSGTLVGREPSTNIAQVGVPAVDVLLGSDSIASDDAILLDTVGRTIDRLVLESARYIPLVIVKALLVRPSPIANVSTNGGLANEYDLVNIGLAPSKAMTPK